MDSPISAFAMYNLKKKAKNQEKKKKNTKNVSSPPKALKEFSDDVIMKVAQKVKQKQKKEKDNNIAKKKLHKKKKNKQPPPPVNKNKKAKRNHNNSESEDVPLLVPAPPLNNILNNSDDECQHSECGSFEFSSVVTDSAEEGLSAFKWMIAPFDSTKFFKHYWEKKPLHITRNKPKYYRDIISTPIIDKMLRKHSIQFTKNIDITSYVNGKRETHNPEGRAHPYLVWDYYIDGCSIRLLNPQTYMHKLHVLNATMQEFFNSFVGANAYLTPPDSQGFAPHYDDIEAFILQSEGKKHWRVYKPRSAEEELPRVSSENFNQDEIGEPVLEVTLVAGDMLYLPRGYIHQGVTIEGEHSLHVTVSMYQKHSYADLLEKLIPAALNLAVAENVEFRKGLPFDIYDNFGIAKLGVDTPRREEIEKVIHSLFEKVKEVLPIDGAVDQMNKNFQHDALPPVLTDSEKSTTVFSDNDVVMKDGQVMNRVEISLDTKIRLLRKNILRLVKEDEIRLFFYVENSLEYHGRDLQCLEIEEDLAPAIETLVNSYPQYVAVENLNVPTDSDKIEVAEALWSRGLIMSEYPLETVDD